MSACVGTLRAYRRYSAFDTASEELPRSHAALMPAFLRDEYLHGQRAP